jgi:Type I restriction modification DNA specificity domain
LGSFYYLKTKHRKPGKVEAPLNDKLEKVEWAEFKLGDLFEIATGRDVIIGNVENGNIPLISHQHDNNGISKNIAQLSNRRLFNYKNTIPLADRGVFLATTQNENFHIGTRVKALTFKDGEKSTKIRGFIVACINKLQILFLDYASNATDNLPNLKIQLPTKYGKIDFDFMESFISELEAERIADLEAYLKFTGLKDYTLTVEEEKVLEDFENINWETFNLENLFGKSTRGRRLKSDDRISGNLPFVTAGETDEGVSAFIGNNVIVFSENTTTIDMFGSAKYRNYKYGGDDHIAVVHTENLPKFASIFVTTAIHKSSYNGQFHYGRNFYAKDADELNISLPTQNNQPNYAIMETLISAIQKLLIKDLVLYADKKNADTKA